MQSRIDSELYLQKDRSYSEVDDPPPTINGDLGTPRGSVSLRDSAKAAGASVRRLSAELTPRGVHRRISGEMHNMVKPTARALVPS